MNSWRFKIYLFGVFVSAACGQAETPRFEICEFDQKAETSSVLFEVSDVVDVQSIAWNPDAERFAIAVTTTGESGKATRRIRTCRRDGSEMQDIGRGQLPSWSPRGRRLTFSRNAPDPGVWIMRADGTDAQIIDSKGWSSRWSPGGNRIAYLRNDADPSEIRIFNLVEGHFRRIRDEGLRRNEEYSAGFTWSPDGSQLGCLTNVDGAVQRISICRVKSGQHFSIAPKPDAANLPICWPTAGSILLTLGESSDFRIEDFDVAVKDSPAHRQSSIHIDDEYSSYNPEVDRLAGTIFYIRMVGK